MNFSSLLPRIATGVLVLAALGLAVWFGFIWMFGLAFVCAVLALWEFYGLFWPGRTHCADKLIGVGMAVMLFAGAWLRNGPGREDVGPDSLILAASLCLLLVAIVFLGRYGSGGGTARLEDTALTLLGVAYVPFTVVLALLLARDQLLLLLAVVAATDTCAYFVGNLWGRRRIWPTVSPKKSVEGCLGGMIGSVLVCLGFGLHQGTAWEINVCLGIGLAVFAMVGDFFESALKRAYDVKDSGTILPGHGGMLDRLDSFLFTVPAYWLFSLVVRLP